MSGFACESFEVLDDEDRVLGTMVEWTEGYPFLEWAEVHLLVKGCLMGALGIIFGLFGSQFWMSFGILAIAVGIGARVTVRILPWRLQRLTFFNEGSIILERSRWLLGPRAVALPQHTGQVVNIEAFQERKEDETGNPLLFGVQLIMASGEAEDIAHKIGKGHARILVTRLSEALAAVKFKNAPKSRTAEALIA